MKSWFGLRVVLGAALAATVAFSPVAAAPATGAHAASPAAAGTVTPASCTLGQKACPIKIVFATGAYSAQASSHLLSMKSARYFTFKAKKNQELVVWVKGAGPTRGTVTFANGTSDGGPGGRVFDGMVPASGKVTIRVTEDSMATQWSGKVTVIVVAI